MDRLLHQSATRATRLVVRQPRGQPNEAQIHLYILVNPIIPDICRFHTDILYERVFAREAADGAPPFNAERHEAQASVHPSGHAAFSPQARPIHSERGSRNPPGADLRRRRPAPFLLKRVDLSVPATNITINNIAETAFMRTAAYEFPVEPHFITPLLLGLPRSIAFHVVKLAFPAPVRRPLAGDDPRLFQRRQAGESRRHAGAVPNGRIYEERFLGLSKS